MTTEFKLPELGENIESGDVVSVLVAVGDTIKENDPVLELETDKATLEVPSSISGVVEAIHVAAGDTISVGQVILTTNGDGTAPAPAEPQAAAPQEAKTAPASAPAPEPAPTPSAEAGPVEFKLPDLGENIESGDVVNVLVSVGDTIGENDPVLELETDKATLEVPSSVGGTIEAIHVNAGDTISVGQIILTLKGGAPAGAPPKTAKPAETPAVTPPA
ncbi:MAG TPA: dihydrolipoyllysine-residue acetyltransferase, partial [Anaerolineae bacterium]|nr:dihydrolipoyllysine-residue acetyltransferase [Anaerolineae bacterium]